MHVLSNSFASLCEVGKKTLLLALGAALISLPARADIPAKGAATDQLGLPINAAAGDVYDLTAGKEVFHGTYHPFPSFKKVGGPYATWFGANRETSEAMGYYRWCSSAKYVSQAAAAASGKKPTLSSSSYESVDPGEWPNLMTVKVKTGQTLNLLLIPYSKTGHFDQFKKIGFDITKSTNKKIKELASLNGAGSFAGMEAMKESELCDTKVWLDEHKHIKGYQKGSNAVVGDGKGTAIQLEGWRAPWDQNELAVCGKVVAEKLEVVSGATVAQSGAEQTKLKTAYTAPLSKALGTQETRMVKLKELIDAPSSNPLHAAAENYKTVFAAAEKEICDEGKATHAGSIWTDNNSTFDIVFTARHPGPHNEADAKPVVEALDEGEGK